MSLDEGFEDFYDEFKEWTKKQILHRTYDICLENADKDNEIERLRKENQQLKEDIKFCINTMKNEYECTDKRTNRELHTMVEILEKWTKEYKEGSD